MISPYLASRSLSEEARRQDLEDHYAQFTAAVMQALTGLQQTGVAIDTAGGGLAAVSSGGGGGGGGGGSLSGDVTGPEGSTTVVAAQHTTLPVPVSPTDDEKFLRYQDATPAYELAHVPLTGDASGTNAAVVVDKAKGIPFPAPGASDDEKALVYDHGTVAYVLRPVTILTLLGAWTHASAATLTGTDAEIANCFAADTTLANAMVTTGELVGLAVKLSGDVGAAGNDVIVTVYKNGVATILTATITGAAGTEDEVVTTVTPVAFAAGDDITVQAKANGTPAAVRVAAQVYGRFKT